MARCCSSNEEKVNPMASLEETHIGEDGLTRSVRKKGRFVNPWPTWETPTFGNLMRWQTKRKNLSQVPSKQELDQTLPIVKPDLALLSNPPESGIRVTWVGHATCLVQMEGISILTDPVFSNRCSPVQFMGPKRYRDVPCTIEELPQIDAVVISHNHYDHLDNQSVQDLNSRFGVKLWWFVPLGLASWMKSAGCENVIELDWWGENCIPEYHGVKFVFTPAQHWCKRGPTDDNKVLWGSWCVLGPKNKFHFAGDTGYCAAFEQIGNKYGPFDLAAISIGAYEPRWFMKPQHLNPSDAVQVHQDLKARKSIGIHWGTFVLTDEFYLEPPEKLQEAMTEKGLPVEDFFAVKHGETRDISENPSTTN